MLALADGARHGYAIKQAVEQRTEVRSGSGRAPCTKRSSGSRTEGSSKRRRHAAAEPANGQEAQRRYYQLTDRGWTSLRKELRALGQLVDVARANPRLGKGLA